MTEPRNLRCYEYVNAPYDAVRNLFRDHSGDIFRRATASAATRSNAVRACLHAEFAGVDIGVDIRLLVQEIRDEEGVAGLSPVTRVAVAWEAERGKPFFPIMNAKISFWPLTSTETQLEIEGAYRPPLGFVGNALDAGIGHRVAEAAVHRFLREMVEEIRTELAPGGS